MSVPVRSSYCRSKRCSREKGTAMIPILDWSQLSERERKTSLQRPLQAVQAEVLATAQRIIDGVRAEGDVALRSLTRELDHVDLEALAVSASELRHAATELSSEARLALDRAISNVRHFHGAQIPKRLVVETMHGVSCERRIAPIGAVGLYVPAGSAPLPSTAIMLAVPAQIAGCPVRVLCTPPRPDGRADAATLYVAQECGIESIYKTGGAQAIAAMAYGTETIPKSHKVFGPGNAW